MVCCVVIELNLSSLVGDIDRLIHSGGMSQAVGIHHDPTVHIARGTTDDLEEGRRGPQESDFLGIEDGDERNLGEVESFSEEIDPDDPVDLAHSEVSDDFKSFDGLDLGVEIANFDTIPEEIIREFFG